jgi:hypothetical protein
LGDPLRVITIKSVTQNPSSQPQRNSVGEVQTRFFFLRVLLEAHR